MTDLIFGSVRTTLTGNSMAVPVIRWIGARIKHVHGVLHP